MAALICDRFGSERHQNAERFNIYCNGPVFMLLFNIRFFHFSKCVPVPIICLNVWNKTVEKLDEMHRKWIHRFISAWHCDGLEWFYWPCVSRLDSEFILHLLAQWEVLARTSVCRTIINSIIKMKSNYDCVARFSVRVRLGSGCIKRSKEIAACMLCIVWLELTSERV